jgi:hypothetical protein
MGKLSVADWWLPMERVVEEETEAAAAPAMTTDRAKMRTASFMRSNSLISLESMGAVLPTLLKS